MILWYADSIVQGERLVLLDDRLKVASVNYQEINEAARKDYDRRTYYEADAIALYTLEKLFKQKLTVNNMMKPETPPEQLPIVILENLQRSAVKVPRDVQL